MPQEVRRPIPVINCRGPVVPIQMKDGKIVRCNKPSVRVGAQDECDVYVCPDTHITRIKVGEAREEYRDEERSS